MSKFTLIPYDVKIEIYSKDDKGKNSDDCYCAIVLGLNKLNKKPTWYNTGIVVRDKDPINAFMIARDRAIEKGWWK